MTVKHELPKIIKDVGFDFNWSEEKVWALDVPVVDMDVAKLEWHLDIPFWWTNNGFYNLAPREVINNPEKHKEEYERVLNADLKHPLDIMFWRGRWLFLDGLHRFVKAYLRGDKTVKVRKIPQEAILQIKN
ncbi:MAG: hypothetical protein G01um10145_288 [Microgenomates group bacterium Gr01-1014_5]|nr:MAG: hypothetical protein G01um10145_288 [Microgenomates group bacterium Gr01-1014_5]